MGRDLSKWKRLALIAIIMVIILSTVCILMLIKLQKTPMFTRSGGGYFSFISELFQPEKPVYGDDEVDFDLFAEALYTTKENYLYKKDVNIRKMIYGAIRGAMASLGDTHTDFMDPEFVKSLREDTKGEFGGLGIYLGYKDGQYIISEPMPDTPAFKAGLKPGDFITEIEGKPTRDMTMEEVIHKLKGEKGTKVTITIERESVLEPFNVTLERDIIKINFIRYTMIKPDIGYIKFSMFTETSALDMLNAILKLKDEGMKKCIIDLRYNPGGLLEAAIDVTNLFIPEGKIVETRSKKQKITHEAKPYQCILPDMPLIVLINQHSASASEIFSGAVKDTNRGILIGEKTFGKGSVQQVFELENANEPMALKITIAEYFTPAGHAVNKKGIEPDLKSSFPKTKISELYMVNEIKDKKMIKAFLKEHTNYTEKDVDGFANKLKDMCIPVDKSLLEQVIEDEANKTKTPPLIYPKYDVQLKKAIDVYNNNEYKTKERKYYFDLPDETGESAANTKVVDLPEDKNKNEDKIDNKEKSKD